MLNDELLLIEEDTTKEYVNTLVLKVFLAQTYPVSLKLRHMTIYCYLNSSFLNRAGMTRGPAPRSRQSSGGTE